MATTAGNARQPAAAQRPTTIASLSYTPNPGRASGVRQCDAQGVLEPALRPPRVCGATPNGANHALDRRLA